MLREYTLFYQLFSILVSSCLKIILDYFKILCLIEYISSSRNNYCIDRIFLQFLQSNISDEDKRLKQIILEIL